MPKLLFTDDNVATLLPVLPSNDVWFWDTQERGLGLRVRIFRDGLKPDVVTRTWILGYSIGGKDRRDPIGKFSEFTLSEARVHVHQRRRDLAEKTIDPRAEKAKREAEATATKTLREAAETFLTHFVGRHSTRRAHERYLRGADYFGPLLGKPIQHITRAQISERLNVIIKDSSKHVAKQARTSLLCVYRQACGDGLLDNIDVVAGTHDPSPKKGQTPRQRKLADAELAEVWNAGDALIRLLILTGCRREEVGGIKWSEISGDTWTLPPERIKVPERTKEGVALPRLIPLSPAAKAILLRVPQVDGRDCVFGPRAWSRIKAQLPALSTPWTLHDLRRTMRSGLSQLGVSDEIGEECIGHKRELLIRTYSPAERLVQQAKAFDLWAAHVEGLVNGSNVVSIRTGSRQCR